MKILLAIFIVVAASGCKNQSKQTQNQAPEKSQIIVQNTTEQATSTTQPATDPAASPIQLAYTGPAAFNDTPNFTGEVTPCPVSSYMRLTLSPTDPYKLWLCQPSASGGNKLVWEPQYGFKSSAPDSLVTGRLFDSVGSFAFPHDGVQYFGWVVAYEGTSALTPNEKLRGFVIKLSRSKASKVDDSIYTLRVSENSNTETKYDMDTINIPEIYLTATHVGLGKVRLDFKTRTGNTTVFSQTSTGERESYFDKLNTPTP